MEFTTISEKEYTNFEQTNDYGSFYQTIEWGKLKETNGWKYFLVGVKENNKIIASALLLKKIVFKNISIIYSPRGFLIDYKNKKLLDFFTMNIKKFAKKNNAIFVKIDPYIIYKERDINGNIVVDGIDNSLIVENLKQLKYKHKGFNMNGDLQPRYAFTLNLKNKTIEDILKNCETTTRQMIKKNEKIGVVTREIKINELNKFTDVMKDTSVRRNFIDRPYSYYENMCKKLGNNIKILVSEIDLNKYINDMKLELNKTKKEILPLKEKINNEYANKKKINNQINELEIIVQSLNKKINRGEELKKKHGDILVLGSLMFILHNKEILSLFGGAYGEYREFMPAYTLNYDMIKYGIENGYDKYNFYGISEFKDKTNEMYGLYEFKRGFGGNIEEYIGEFDLVISNFWYFMYNVVYSKIYLKIKSLILNKKSSN